MEEEEALVTQAVVVVAIASATRMRSQEPTE
jgi:hypothetical protein